MREEKSVVAYLVYVDEIVNTIKNLGEKIEESIVVQKTLRSLPLCFDAKVAAIEEMKDFDKLTVDELHGILTAYEMRTIPDQSTKKEVAFKVSKKGKDKELATSDSSNED